MAESYPNLNRVTMRLAIAWGVLFSLASLSTAIAASLAHVKWNALDGQDRFLMVLAIFGNWSAVIMAFLSKTVARMESGRGLPTNGDTAFLSKTETKQPTTTN